MPVLCLVLWKNRAQSCLHGAEVGSGASICPVVSVIAARLKRKKKKNQSKPTLYVEGRPKGSPNPLRKGHSSAERLECISVGQPQSPSSALSAAAQTTCTGGEPRAGALLRQYNGELCEHELLHCTVLCHKESGGQWTHSTPKLSPPALGHYPI